ncbi:MAG: DUF4340 domain-containing protein [SAR202 cluster bacterium]|nr:DUF4340 domain-containing protein [SAR202 cluster bacterium]
MSLRISLVLIIVVSLAGIALTWVIKNPPIGSSKEADLPFFYTLSPDDLRQISITTPVGKKTFYATFVDDGRNVASVWYFEDPAGIPVNFDRWGGITFLLGGPKTQRILAKTIDDPAQYGLNRPTAEITMTLRDGSVRTLILGAPTPDRGAHYAQLAGFPELVLVDSTWGDVLTRLVAEPPLPLWYYTLDKSKAHEVLFYLKNDVIQGVSFNDETKTWVLCDLPIAGDPCEGSRAVNADRLNNFLSAVSAPRFTRAEKVSRSIEEARHGDYGLDLNSPYVTVRIEKQNRQGITEVTVTTLTLGNLTPDGKEMFVLANEQPTVARVTADWGKLIQAFFVRDSLAP